MRCDDFETEIGCFIDGELAPPEQREVENHLNACPACKSHVAEQQKVKSLLRQTMQRPSAPAETAALLSRVRTTLDRDDGRGGWRWRLATVQPFVRAALGIFVPIVAALGLVLGYVETIEPLITDSIVRHQRNLPLEVTGGPETVQSWFDGKVPFAVPAPTLGPHCSLRGGRISHLGGREAALLQYDKNGQKISVFVFDAQGMPSALRLRAPERRIIGNREVFIEDTSGYHVAVFRDRGLGYAIAGSVDESQLIQMISAAVSQNR